MHILRSACVALLVCAVTSALAGGGFKPYPGAVKYTPPDTQETRDVMKSLPPGTTSTTFLTKDPFEKVVAFYKDSGKEYKMPHMRTGGRLPTGEELKQTFLIFDNAADIGTSKNWANVQYPFVGSVGMKGGVPEYHDVRDVTTITLIEKK